MERTHTISWQDPMASAEAGRTMSGLDYMNAMMRGEVAPAPIAHLLNMRLIEVENGRSLFTAVPAEYHYNPIGVVHAGFAATLIDSAMGCAVHTTLPAGAGYTTLEFKIHLVRAITVQTGTVTVEGRVVHGGKRMATAEAQLRDSTGKLLAHGTTTCMIFGLD